MIKCGQKKMCIDLFLNIKCVSAPSERSDCSPARRGSAPDRSRCGGGAWPCPRYGPPGRTEASGNWRQERPGDECEALMVSTLVLHFITERLNNTLQQETADSNCCSLEKCFSDSSDNT